MRPTRLIDADARSRIEAAVREAERGTSGEIVVTIVRACDDYGRVPWRLGALGAALALLGGALVWPAAPVAALLGLQAAALALAHAACRVDAVRRAFVGEDELEARAREHALRAFAEHGVRKTRERTGILIFVALFEHRVVVLGDSGIDAALDPATSWQQVVDLALAGIRAGRAADGLVDAVRRCGEILARPLPPRGDDRDEIHVALVLED